MDRIRVALIGTGFGAQVHAPGFRAVPDYELVGICSETRAQAEAVAGRFDVPFATDDYRELVARDDVDLVSISTPPHLHLPMTLSALEAGKHILCEKPTALDVGEARQMLAAARESGRVHAIDHEFRYVPVHRQVRRLVKQGYVGRLRYLVGTVNTSLGVDPAMPWFYDSWRTDKRKGGGNLSGVLSHHIDLVRVWFGEIAAVQGHTATLVGTKPVLLPGHNEGDPLGSDVETRGENPVSTDDTSIVTGVLREGGLFTLSGSWSLHHGSGIRVEIYGDEGTLVVKNVDVVTGARGTDKRLEKIPPEAEDALPEGTKGVIGAFAAVISDLKRTLRGESHDPLYATFEDGVRNQEVIDAVRAQSDSTWVRLSED